MKCIFNLTLFTTLLLFTLSCENKPTQTLIVYIHNGVYEFIGPDGHLNSVKSVENFEKAINREDLRSYIVDNRVLIRYIGDPNSNDLPNAAILDATARLALTGLTIDYEKQTAIDSGE